MFKITLLIFFSNLFLTNNAFAYLGIAPLIPLIGQGILFIFGIVVIFFGIIFYPIKLLFKKKEKTKIEKKDK
jgi:hypothetical protein